MLLASLTLGVLALDQLSKAAVRSRIAEDADPIRILPFLDIRHVHNTGIAFGMFSGRGSIVIVATLVVGALLMFLLSRMASTGGVTIAGIAMIAGGALGNITDRVRLGFVVDFINIPHWPTFNVADMAIVCGVALVLVSQRDGGGAEATADPVLGLLDDDADLDGAGHANSR